MEAVCTVTASTAFTVWHTVLHAEDLHTAPSRSVLPESQAPRPGHPRLRAAEKCLSLGSCRPRSPAPAPAPQSEAATQRLLLLESDQATQ